MPLPPLIAPSILAADFARLGDEVDAVLAAGADVIHFDVMDNHYVPNLTVGPGVLKALRDHGVTAPIEAHLMAQPVDKLAQEFIYAGASCITIHPEAAEYPDLSLRLIREGGAKAGVALNPGTPLAAVEHLLHLVDVVLVMSVHPGFGGQKFIAGSLDAVRAVRERLDAEASHEVRLEVDGGIHAGNIGAVRAAGADMFVAGTAIFGAPDYAAAIAQLRAELD